MTKKWHARTHTNQYVNMKMRSAVDSRDKYRPNVAVSGPDKII